MRWVDAVIAVMALLIGFMAGLLTFKRSERWCPNCGNGLICGRCTAAPPLPRDQAHATSGHH